METRQILLGPSRFNQVEEPVLFPLLGYKGSYSDFTKYLDTLSSKQTRALKRQLDWPTEDSKNCLRNLLIDFIGEQEINPEMLTDEQFHFWEHSFSKALFSKEAQERFECLSLLRHQKEYLVHEYSWPEPDYFNNYGCLEFFERAQRAYAQVDRKEWKSNSFLLNHAAEAFVHHNLEGSMPNRPSYEDIIYSLVPKDRIRDEYLSSRKQETLDAASDSIISILKSRKSLSKRALKADTTDCITEAVQKNLHTIVWNRLFLYEKNQKLCRGDWNDAVVEREFIKEFRRQGDRGRGFETMASKLLLILDSAGQVRFNTAFKQGFQMNAEEFVEKINNLIFWAARGRTVQDPDFLNTFAAQVGRGEKIY